MIERVVEVSHSLLSACRVRQRHVCCPALRGAAVSAPGVFEELVEELGVFFDGGEQPVHLLGGGRRYRLAPRYRRAASRGGRSCRSAVPDRWTSAVF